MKSILNEKRAIGLGLYVLLVVSFSSCLMAAIKLATSGMMTYNELFKKAKNLTAGDKGYYKIQKNGDTLTATPKEGIEIVKKTYCRGCELSPTNIVECSTKYGIVRWNDSTWVTYFVKGKVNMYYTFRTVGYHTEWNPSSDGKRSIARQVPDREFTYFFQKGHGEWINIKSIELIRNAIKDNPACLEKLNTLVPAGGRMEESKVGKMAHIMELYNGN